MNMQTDQNKLPVLLLYNLDPAWLPMEIDESRELAQKLCNALRGEGHPVTEACLEDQDLAGLLQYHDPDKCILFNTCEEIPGIPHSYDLIAKTLEDLGFIFTGADSKALSLNQDKRLVKQRLEACGLPTPRWQVFNSASRDGWKIFPAIVKPALDHCSFGVTRDSVVWSEDELTDRMGYIIDAFQGPALVEEFIDGSEFHVTVIGNGRLHMLPPAEMDFSAFQEARDRLCTYESKHDPASKAYNLIRLHLPARISEEDEKKLGKVALAGYRAASCRDYARLDIRRRDGIFYILDINPNADISLDTSPVLSAELVGLSYGKFCSWLVSLAARRHPILRKLAGKKEPTGALFQPNLARVLP
jgi:D-alanine-D-alanine ligase